MSRDETAVQDRCNLAPLQGEPCVDTKAVTFARRDAVFK